MRVEPSGPGWMNPDWRCPPRVRSAFSLRTGGVSAAPFDSLNLGAHVGDSATAVAENRRRLALALALPAAPLWLHQQHGTVVVDADRLAPGAEPPPADAAVTQRPGRVLAVLVADCVPVLLARADGSAIAVAHAGWRGLCDGVIEAAVGALRAGDPGSAPTCAWLGPSIGPAHFEVGEEVRAAFVARDAAAAAAFLPNARGRWQCDLHALARRRLAALGVGAVDGAIGCTAGHPARYFSFRRDRTTGRMAALVWLQPEGTGA
jgi:polyphenol oxidase